MSIHSIKLRLKLYLNKFIFNIADKYILKENSVWIFPVYFIGEGAFVDNSLSIFLNVKNNPSIKKVILTRQRKIHLDGKNVVVLPMNSWRAVWYLLKAKTIFVQHSLWLDLKDAKFQIIDPKERIIVNLWHGIPIKDIAHKNTGIINRRSLIEMKNYRVIVSSHQDKINMQKAFYNVSSENFWLTGLPRNDFLIMKEELLPESYKDDLYRLRQILDGKKLWLYAPTYRETNVGGKYYQFSNEEIDILTDLLEKNNTILGIRYHLYRQPDFKDSLFKTHGIVDLSENIIADIRMLIRESEVVVTDYSSLFVDAIYIEKPCISFAYDFEHYMQTQRGFFYDFETIFPGPVCKTFQELIVAIESMSSSQSNPYRDKIENTRNILFKYIDEHNSERVVRKLEEILAL